MEARIIEKIKKCLALSESPNPHEAEAALLRAQELMAKHGVTSDQLNSSVGAEQVVEERVRSMASASRCKDWELRLFRQVAKAFSCDLLFARGVRQDVARIRGLPSSATFGSYLIVGLPEDVAVCKYAVEVLQKQLVRARATFTRGLSSYLDRRQKSDEVDSYCDGWVVSATKKVQPLAEAKAREARAQGGESLALVVLSKEEQKLALVRNHVKAKATGNVKLNHSDRGSYEAYIRGQRDGEKASVHRPLAANSTGQGALR